MNALTRSAAYFTSRCFILRIAGQTIASSASNLPCNKQKQALCQNSIVSLEIGVVQGGASDRSESQCEIGLRRMRLIYGTSVGLVYTHATWAPFGMDSSAKRFSMYSTTWPGISTAMYAYDRCIHQPSINQKESP